MWMVIAIINGLILGLMINVAGLSDRLWSVIFIAIIYSLIVDIGKLLTQ